ncbi:hypothetical protein SAMN06296036_106126 [Pseudobacteriovorax antillogorgiicola]|uniref:Uncharacterized protein n=1 Tax=Pseudobacteriovorax antillogorgiicola TaxID=1513793 RepID=A0A1Y6BMQ6_9BACT|nr:hypothetical protein EDD56_106117 [Pseudobacteriovorax antillogorgiicola]SMF17615.1 hypothetical protein SAMN06296036_106126 [Pseudobacteriovorax antillogorgiicola]
MSYPVVGKAPVKIEVSYKFIDIPKNDLETKLNHAYSLSRPWQKGADNNDLH